MNKEEFLSGIGKALDKISESERTEILYDYEEHFLIGRENGKSEEEICLELGDPVEIANNYLSNHINENIEIADKEEIKKNISSTSGNNKRNLFAIFAITAGILICIFANSVTVPKHKKSVINMNNDGIQVGGIRIDSSGIHGGGISIDSDGVKVPGVRIDNNGVKVPGVSVGNNGVSAPGISIDDNGVKVPGVSIDNNGVKIPGIKIDVKGVKVDLPNVKIDIKN
jgi:hypothetical protein